MMTRGQPIHHFGFSGRTDFNRLAVFYRPYFFDNFRAFDQQILNLIINAGRFPRVRRVGLFSYQSSSGRPLIVCLP